MKRMHWTAMLAVGTAIVSLIWQLSDRYVKPHTDELEKLRGRTQALENRMLVLETKTEYLHGRFDIKE
jgi:hypothetical protein